MAFAAAADICSNRAGDSQSSYSALAIESLPLHKYPLSRCVTNSGIAVLNDVTGTRPEAIASHIETP